MLLTELSVRTPGEFAAKLKVMRYREDFDPYRRDIGGPCPYERAAGIGLWTACDDALRMAD